MTTGKRLYHYALQFKSIIAGALVLLTFSAAADLAGPFIAKRVIDIHILGIESVWHETEQGDKAVEYDGTYYKRDIYFNEGETKGAPAEIFQAGTGFVFVGEEVDADGDRSYSNGTLTIKNGDIEKNYPATALSAGDVMRFSAPELPGIVWLLALYFGLAVVSAFFQYWQRYMLQKSANRVIQKMREDVYARIQKLPVSFFDNLPAGKIVARITNDTEAVRELYVTVLSTFFTGGIYIIGIYIALFILNPNLAAITLLLLPILYAWMVIYRKFASRYNHKIRSRNSEINAMVNESIQGMNVIQAFGREKESIADFEKLNEDHFRNQNKMLNLNSLTSFNLVNVLRNIVFVVFIWYFGGESLEASSAISLGMLYAFVDYINRLFEPVVGMVNQQANLEQALVAGERVFQLMDEPEEEERGTELERYNGNVRFDNVSFAYKEGEWVLKNINFEARPGETVALVGHTGSGKSSIMNLLFRFYDCQKGAITIDGIDVKHISRNSLRRQMGIVLQDPYLFTGTIASNVSLGDPSISRERVEKALKDVGADEIFKNLENGYDSAVTEKGSTFSSGQRQLISFARALSFDPAILILDEATSSIDSETEAIIQEAMEVLKKGRTTFIIAHRLSTIRNADQILVLDKGEIVEKGNHDDLMEQKGRYYQMYQLQLGKGNLAG
ncbi:multidrug ABC transporter permease [Bacillus sp. FJAT-27225]|uniref:ABC transporter ATP-binding protein n=1 Tax=Bacillus sp. FJAT-27225 TaxID=1743144 RepID=UPI00080C2D61|nr:ABC transporter ATP-binding protein [Bacillus sp. FJAT-27225]OCA84373.1 multidrug ABC transporter permease [Bacillus sp. FJAT-27225]